MMQYVWSKAVTLVKLFMLVGRVLETPRLLEIFNIAGVDCPDYIRQAFIMPVSGSG